MKPTYSRLDLHCLFLMIGGIMSDPCRTICKCSDHNVVYCNGTGITQVPQYLPPGTKYLSLSNNKIRNISRSDLNGLSKLTSIDLGSNGLQEGGIEEGALELPLLNNIGLSSNNFVSIPDVLPKHVVSLSLKGNKIIILTNDSFVDYGNISNLELSNNRICKIEDNTFYPLSNLLMLDLSYNELRNEGLPWNLFIENSKMTTLKVRFNNLEQLIGHLPASLQHLDYVGNPIGTIRSNAFKELHQLQTLEIYQSGVSVVEDNAFAGLVNLTYLDLNQARLTNITADTFNGLPSLKMLYMGINDITTIAPTAFHKLGNMTSLLINDNQLSTLDSAVLETKFLPKLEEVYMGNNPWYCDCHLKWLNEILHKAPYYINYTPVYPCTGPPEVAGRRFDFLAPSEFVCHRLSRH